MSVVIEKNVPPPIPKCRLKRTRQDRGNRMKLPFKAMEVGDSILVPPAVMTRKNIQIVVSRLGNDLRRKFITRIEGNSTRIWRVL